MKRVICRLTLANKSWMGGGGGGGSDIMMRDPKTEQKSIQQFNVWDFLGPNSQLSKFTSGQPLLKTAEGGALDFWKQLGPMLGKLSGSFNALPGAQGITDLESAYQKNIAPTIASGGALSAEGARDASQLARLNPGGSLRDVGAVVREAQGRESAMTQRLNTALGQAGAFRGLETGISQGQQSAASGIQGLQTGGLNQLLGVEGGKVGAFSQLQNPILGYLGNLFSGNQSASVAGSQISAQQGAAGDAKMGSSIGGALSAVGSIAAVAL